MKKNKKSVIIQEAKKELARRDLLYFTQHTYPKYQVFWHHAKYAKKLDEFIRGEIKKLMVFMPPQHGKSELSTRRVPALILGQDPTKKIGITAYNHTVASKFNRDIQRIIDSPEYQELFPKTYLNRANIRTVSGSWLRNADEFEIVKQCGSLVSVGVGGGLTSRQLDVLIIDDPYKDAADAWSETVRNNVANWFDTVAETRLHNDSQILIVFTRWHEEDLAGYILKHEPDQWEIVKFPALKEARHMAEIPEDPRPVGAALWPEKHAKEKLLRIRKKNSIVFDSLYQQEPTPKEGLLFPCGDLKRFRHDQIRGQRPSAIIAAVDIADEGDDYLSAPIAQVHGDEVYITGALFTQDPIEVTQPLLAERLIRAKTDRARLESNFGGKGYALKIRELTAGSGMHIDWKATVKNKHTRIIMASGDIKERFYFLDDRDQDPEYRAFFHQLTHYPKTGKVKHDDAADSVTMLRDFLKSAIGPVTVNL